MFSTNSAGASESRFKMKLKEYLKKQNVRPADIGKVLITFKFAAYTTWIVLVPICGKFQPLRRFFRLSGPKNLKEAFIRRYPERYASWEQHFINGAEWVARHKTIRWIPETFGQKHRDFGLSIAEATVLYKLLFPIWAPLEFMYIVRVFKKKWDVSDLSPVPLSTQEYADLYTQTSSVDVFSLSSDVDENGENKNNEDNNNRNNGGGGTVSSHKNISQNNRNGNGINPKMNIHTFSSSLSHLIPSFMDRIKQEKENSVNQWYQQMNSYRYGITSTITNIGYYF
eukprot:254025_1